MIQPIRAVGSCVPGIPPSGCCRFRLSLACVMQFRNLNAIWAEHRIRMALPNRLAAPLGDVLQARLLCGDFAPRAGAARGVAETRPPRPETVDLWQPWPAHPPFADEVRRWWPSDELPPLPPVAAGTPQSQQTPIIIQWADRGGLIDFWA